MVKRTDGRWQEAVTIDGKRHFFYGKTKAEVLKKIQTYQSKKATGADFAPVAAEWWAEHEPTLAYKSMLSYRPAYNRAVEAFGDLPISSIEPREIYALLERMGKTYAHKTVTTQLLVVNLIFKYAVAHGYVSRNPARDVAVPTGLAKTKRRAPDQETIRKVQASSGCTFGLFAYMALYTGLRRGELLALTWEDFDLDKREINVIKSLYHVGNQPRLKKPKTEASMARVPILDALLPKLEKKTGPVFANAAGGYLTVAQFDALWGAYQRESGVDCTPHQLRHAYATMLFEAGIPPEEMQILLRHAQLSTTMDVYREIRADRVSEIHSHVLGVNFSE